MTTFKGFTRILLGAASAVALASVAHAADAVVYEQPPEAVTIEPGFTWTGLYIGANLGYSWGDFDQSLDLAPIPILLPGGLTENFEADADGITGGVQIGYNWQVNNFVFGVEADIQAADVEGSDSQEFLAGLVGVEMGTELDWFGTVRGRIGFVPAERLLVYGTGGFAFGRTTSTASITAPILGTEEVSDSMTRNGWTAGAGAEYAITNNWTFKTEYLYTDLGDEDFYSLNDGPIDLNLSSEVKFHTVRGGLNYKF